MKVKIDSVGYIEKPQNFGQVNNRIGNTPAKEIEFNTFCDLVGNKGHSFCVSDLKGTKRCKEEFKSQQLFGLDFDNKDNKVTFEEILKRAESYGLPVALAYETLSSVNQDKFRVVFMTAFPVIDVRVAEVIIESLMLIFYECDRACSDVVRIFLGGKKLIYSQEQCISIEKLMMEFPRFQKQLDEKYYKSTVEKFCNKHNLLRMGGFPHILTKISDDYYEFVEGDKLLYINFCEKAIEKNIRTKVKKIRTFNFNILKDKCKLYKEFTDDERRLHHNELFGIATNLINIESGRKMFLQDIVESGFEHYKEKDWYYYTHYMSTQGYAPASCEKFCPYHNECNHATNMLLTAKTNKNSVVKLKEVEYCSVEEAEKEVKEALYKAVNTPFDGINIIKAQTAIGKTYCYVNLIKEVNKKFIVAVPTNILKEEVYDWLIREGVTNVVMTKSVQTLEDMDDEVGEMVRTYNAAGAHDDLVEYIKKVSKEEGKEYLREYIKPLADYCTEENRVIVTTHKKFLNNRKDIVKDYEIIIDEDILFSGIKNSGTILFDELKKINKIEKVRRFLEECKDSDEKYILSEEELKYVPYKTIVKKGISGDINGFLRARALCVRMESIGGRKEKVVHYLVPPVLIKTKCTILSATADKKLYAMFFPYMPIRYYDCREAKFKGKLLQDCTRSYSRKDIDSDKSFFKRLKKENPGFENIITFSKYETIVKCRLHFGNTEGINNLKGKNLLVVGTPYYSEFVYKLIATYIGVNTDEMMRYQEVEDERYKYWLHTYENPDLRAIQLYFLKSELIQAVGRARLLRYDCTVKLYASVPLSQAIIE